MIVKKKKWHPYVYTKRTFQESLDFNLLEVTSCESDKNTFDSDFVSPKALWREEIII